VVSGRPYPLTNGDFIDFHDLVANDRNGCRNIVRADGYLASFLVPEMTFPDALQRAVGLVDRIFLRVICPQGLFEFQVTVFRIAMNSIAAGVQAVLCHSQASKSLGLSICLD